MRPRDLLNVTSAMPEFASRGAVERRWDIGRCWEGGEGDVSLVGRRASRDHGEAREQQTMLIAIDVGRRCSGCVSGVSGAVDCGLLYGQARDSSAQDMIAQTLRGGVGDVVVVRVSCWVP